MGATPIEKMSRRTGLLRLDGLPWRSDGPPGTAESAEGVPVAAPAKTSSKRMVAAALIVVVIIVVGVAATLEFRSPTPSGVTIESTHYKVSPDAVVSAAVLQNQAGYVLESSKPGGASGGNQSGSWALLGNPAGSSANMTVVVFSSMNASQAYYDSFVGSVKGLEGYQDVSSDVSSYQQYGKCYAYGEDVDSIAVVNGVCTKGNVFLQVHLASGVAFPQLESDLTSLMGALYSAVG